jgi:hypothetical protein
MPSKVEKNKKAARFKEKRKRKIEELVTAIATGRW